MAKNNANTKRDFFLVRWIKALFNYFAESYRELKKVSWPNRSELFKSTMVVIVIVALTALLVFLFDTIFTWLTGWFYNFF